MEEMSNKANESNDEKKTIESKEKDVEQNLIATKDEKGKFWIRKNEKKESGEEKSKGISIDEITREVAEASNSIENNNSKARMVYFLNHLFVWNQINRLSEHSVGTFGTGYPFYSLKYNLKDGFSPIEEQIRYDNELLAEAKDIKNKEWICASCLYKNAEMMPDLKQICKPCPNMKNELKPRKIINRLPDLDFWTICEDGKIEETSDEILRYLKIFNMDSSDNDPLRTIRDVKEIAEDLDRNKVPNRYLPMDVHIIENSKLKQLIKQVPEVLIETKKNSDHIAYLPIHPLSYRKSWQYDDTAYNFIFDYLFSFTVLNADKELIEINRKTKREVSNDFTNEELINTIKSVAVDGQRRRMNNERIIDVLNTKFDIWRGKNKDKNELYREGDRI